jgi:hypothetical protein
MLPVLEYHALTLPVLMLLEKIKSDHATTIYASVLKGKVGLGGSAGAEPPPTLPALAQAGEESAADETAHLAAREAVLFGGKKEKSKMEKKKDKAERKAEKKAEKEEKSKRKTAKEEKSKQEKAVGPEKGSGGLLSIFRRGKKSGGSTASMDPPPAPSSE